VGGEGLREVGVCSFKKLPLSQGEPDNDQNLLVNFRLKPSSNIHAFNETFLELPMFRS
jgi:hypothetical protein